MPVESRWTRVRWTPCRIGPFLLRWRNFSDSYVSQTSTAALSPTFFFHLTVVQEAQVTVLDSSCHRGVPSAQACIYHCSCLNPSKPRSIIHRWSWCFHNCGSSVVTAARGDTKTMCLFLQTVIMAGEPLEVPAVNRWFQNSKRLSTHPSAKCSKEAQKSGWSPQSWNTHLPTWSKGLALHRGHTPPAALAEAESQIHWTIHHKKSDQSSHLQSQLTFTIFVNVVIFFH